MRLLVIGGTRFVGRHSVEAALAAGHDVTLVHRSATTLFPSARHVPADRNDDLSALAGEWDATVDVCGYLPAQVHSLAAALGDRGGHQVLVSSVSVYADLPGPGGDEDSALLPAEGADVNDVNDVTDTTYGPLKVCVRARRDGDPRRSIGHRPPDLRGGHERLHGQVSLVGPARAEAAGLRHRPLSESVRDTVAWATDDRLVDGVGLTTAREAQLLARWTRSLNS